MRNTQPYCEVSADRYVWRQRRRLFGGILAFVAAIGLFIALAYFLVASNPTFFIQG